MCIVCGFDLIVVSLLWLCWHFCFLDMFVFGCAVDPVVLMRVLCSSPSQYPPFPKAYLLQCSLSFPSFFPPRILSPQTSLCCMDHCAFVPGTRWGEKSGHWIYEAVGINCFFVFFGLLCGSGVELRIIMPTHSVPSLG